MIQENISLKPYNTFGIDALAKQFAGFKSIAQLNEILSMSKSKSVPFILGGGSNILLHGNIDRLVLKNEITGIEKVREDEDNVYVRAGAGENWHQFVLTCIKNGWAGVENLSLIPGCVGASPMQNIGAYGVEISTVFHELKAFHLEEKTNYTFGLKDCAFGYRDSVFKRKYKDQFVITEVIFRLSKSPVFHIEYGAIKEQLEKTNVTTLSIEAISNAVIAIRRSKLPDPAVIGNAGSFFKNPTVTHEKFAELNSAFPELPGYKNADGSVKLAAGWLIEQAGWKGYREGDAGCHEKQALVLVNYGNASGQQILSLADKIHDSVQAKYGVNLEREVNVI